LNLAPDFNEFIGSLIARDVEFVVVGAYALAFHGVPRFTGDLDVLVRPTETNAVRVLEAVAAFGFPVTNLHPGDIVAGTKILQMGIEPVQIHVMSSCWMRHLSCLGVWPGSGTTRARTMSHLMVDAF
jgi:hypothetical protein